MKNLLAFPCGGEILRFAQQNDMKSAIYDRAKYNLAPTPLGREDWLLAALLAAVS